MLTSPEPWGKMLILLFPIETIDLPFTSRSPPSCGDESSLTEFASPDVPYSSAKLSFTF